MDRTKNCGCSCMLGCLRVHHGNDDPAAMLGWGPPGWASVSGGVEATMHPDCTDLWHFLAARPSYIQLFGRVVEPAGFKGTNPCE